MLVVGNAAPIGFASILGVAFDNGVELFVTDCLTIYDDHMCNLAWDESADPSFPSNYVWRPRRPPQPPVFAQGPSTLYVLQ